MSDDDAECCSDNEVDSLTNMINTYVAGPNWNSDEDDITLSDLEDDNEADDKEKQKRRLDKILDYRYYKHLLHKQARKIIDKIETKDKLHQ